MRSREQGWTREVAPRSRSMPRSYTAMPSPRRPAEQGDGAGSGLAKGRNRGKEEGVEG